jgi:hypothetical protein
MISIILSLFLASASADAPKYSVKISKDARKEAIAKAKVWLAPQQEISRADLMMLGERSNEITCRWDPYEEFSGTTPKFYCKTTDGQKIKIKYGRRNQEIPAELASSRLFRALGFGADIMEAPGVVRCFGCPKDPKAILIQLHSHNPEVQRSFLQNNGVKNKNGEWEYIPDYSTYFDFTYTTVETRMPKHGLKVGEKSGWSFQELDNINPELGASKAEVDAFRLLTVFVNHGDNKVDNQRLVCLTDMVKGHCSEPMAIIHDMGANFGKTVGINTSKFDVNMWNQNPIWLNQKTCTVSIKSSPLGTFGKPTISEAGRKFLSDLLGQLSDQQIRDLFEGAYADQFSTAGAGSVEKWLMLFKERRAIIQNTVCPN